MVDASTTKDWKFASVLYYSCLAFSIAFLVLCLQVVVPADEFHVSLTLVDASETKNRKRVIADAIAQARRPFFLQNPLLEDPPPPSSPAKSGGRSFLGLGRSTPAAARGGVGVNGPDGTVTGGGAGSGGGGDGGSGSHSRSASGLPPGFAVGEPLFRCVLVKLSPTESQLALVFSGMVFDGVSSATFYSDLMEAYASAAAPTGMPDLPRVPSLADAVAWERTALASTPGGGHRRDTDLAYWTHLLKPLLAGGSGGGYTGGGSGGNSGGGYGSSSGGGGSFPERSLASFSKAIVAPDSMAPIPKAGLGRAVRALTSGAYVAVTVPATLRRHLEVAAHQQGATLFMVLQAAFHALLHLWSLSPVVAVAVPVARRPILGLQVCTAYASSTVATVLL